MTTSTSWTQIDLSDADARADAVAYAQNVLEQAGEAHFLHDLEWALCGGDSDQGALAFRTGGDDGVLGFALLLRQARPLRFQLGELTYYRQKLTRYVLWSAPVIAGVPEDSEAWKAAARAFLDAVRRHISPSFEVIGVEGLRIDGPFHRLLYGDPDVARNYLLIEQGKSFEHQFIELPPTLEDYMNDLGKRSKKSLGYSRRKLFKDFDDDVTITCFDREDGVQAFLDHAIEISKKTYQWRLLGLGLRDRDALENRLVFAARKGWLRNYIMYCSGSPVAFMLGYQYNQCFYYTDVGFDPEYSKWSVGSILQLMVMEDLYARNNRPKTFDFSTGFGDHKARFSNRILKEINVLLLPRSFRHAMLANTYKGLDGLAQSAISTVDRMGLKQTLKKSVRRLAASKTIRPFS